MPPKLDWLILLAKYRAINLQRSFVKNTLIMKAFLNTFKRLKLMFITVFIALRLIKALVYCLMRDCFENQRS